MNLTLREARPATAAEWDAVWTACPYATYFHSRAWSEDWSTYTRGSLVPAPELVTFSDERRALLPITRQLRRRGLAVRNILSPADLAQRVALLRRARAKRAALKRWYG